MASILLTLTTRTGAGYFSSVLVVIIGLSYRFRKNTATGCVDVFGVTYSLMVSRRPLTKTVVAVAELRVTT
jgi:hypothetical protein